MTTFDYIIISVTALAVLAIVAREIWKRKKGKGGCGCGSCGGCPHANACHTARSKEKEGENA